MKIATYMPCSGRSARKAQQAAWLQIGSRLANAPASCVTATGPCARRNSWPHWLVHPDQLHDPGDADLLFALRSLAQGHRDLSEEITAIEQRMLSWTPRCGGRRPSRSARAARTGTGALAVRIVRPTPPSTTSVKNRMTNDERTRAYRDAHLAKAFTKCAVHWPLKRVVAHEVFAVLTGHCDVRDYTDLRLARRASNITLITVVAEVWPARAGEFELGRRRDDDFANRYRAWLTHPR